MPPKTSDASKKASGGSQNTSNTLQQASRFPPTASTATRGALAGSLGGGSRVVSGVTREEIHRSDRPHKISRKGNGLYPRPSLLVAAPEKTPRRQRPARNAQPSQTPNNSSAQVPPGHCKNCVKSREEAPRECNWHTGKHTQDPAFAISRNTRFDGPVIEFPEGTPDQYTCCKQQDHDAPGCNSAYTHDFV